MAMKKQDEPMDDKKKLSTVKIKSIKCLFQTFLLFCLLLGMMGEALQAQEKSLPGQFQEARQLAFDQKTQEAREICYDILSRDPDYHDARVLAGRTLIWDDMQDSARKELLTVYKQMPKHYDCLQSLIDLERWGGNYSKALEYANEGAKYFPNDQQMIYKKAEILHQLGRDEMASQTLEYLLTINPAHKEGNTLYKELNPGLVKQAGLVHRFNYFRKPWIKRWHLTSARVDMNLKNTLLIGMVNYGRLFGSLPPSLAGSGNTGFQYWLDAYPRLSSSDYLYLNYAYSASQLFPEHRYGAEWFHNFESGVELSGGFRGFNLEDPLFIYTGSLGLYYQKYWFAFRAWINPGERFTSQTYTLRARRYMATSDDFVGMKLEYGYSPESLAYVGDFEEINQLNTLGFHLEYQENIRHWLFKLDLIYRDEEYREDHFRDHISTELHIMYQFY